jgi:large subunit ribosomal protein L25
MHEEAPVLSAKARDRVGSRYARRARAAGGLPAVVYGHKEAPVSVTLDAHEAILHFQKGERVFTLDVEGAGQQTVLLKEVQYDHLGTKIVHADLARVDLNERVDVTVPIHIIGESDCAALSKAGATLMHPMSSIDLECAVTNLPEYIEVDVRDLEVGGSIHAKDVTLPKATMKLRSDPESVVAHIVIHMISEESDESRDAAGEGAQPEVLTEKKAED